MNKINLSTYIKSRRQSIGMTQKQLAELLGVTDVTISRWESGQRQPMWYQFVKLCEVLGMELERFVEKENGNNDKLKAEIEQLKSRTCQSCVNKGKCAIFDNFNIDYCSDWEKGGSNGNSKKSR